MVMQWNGSVKCSEIPGWMWQLIAMSSDLAAYAMIAANTYLWKFSARNILENEKVNVNHNNQK